MILFFFKCYNIAIIFTTIKGLTVISAKLRAMRTLAMIAVLAPAVSGCLSISPPNIDMSTSVTTLTGAPFCDSSSDGKMVACGAIAQVCQNSPDGHLVACGGMATVCATSHDGKMVACGGRANHCAKSSDGKMVACGGAAPFCDKSSDGRMVACGGTPPRAY